MFYRLWNFFPPRMGNTKKLIPPDFPPFVAEIARSFTNHAPKTSTMPPKKEAPKDSKPPADTKGEKGAAPDAKDAAKKGKGKK